MGRVAVWYWMPGTGWSWTGWRQEDWQGNCLQKSRMICYAVRSSFGTAKIALGGGPTETWRRRAGDAERSMLEPAVRLVVHGEILSHESFATKVQIRRQNGYENLNLFSLNRV
jgi:hypothetical protein